MKNIGYSDIPRNMGNAEGVMTERHEKEVPLIVEWARRNEAVKTVGDKRSADFYDTYELPQDFEETIDVLDERDRRKMKQFYWQVPRTSPHYTRAEKELSHITNFYGDAVELSRHRYTKRKQSLLDDGYARELVESVPEPPAEVPRLHMVGECTGEVHRYKRKGYAFPVEVCHGCHRIFSRGTKMEDLEYVGPALLPQNPNCEWYVNAPDDDYASLEEKRKGLEIMRSVLKIAGVLINVSDAAELLDVTTQNLSNNYIARDRLRAWPDPDDSRYRLVLKYEINELLRKEK